MHKEMTILAATLVLGGLFVASSTLEAHAFGYTFTELNVPGSQPDSTGTGGVGLNNLGQIVGNYYDSAGNSEGFLYTGGKYVTIDEPGATDTYLYGINDFGQILGVSVYFSTGKSYVFLDTHGTFTNIADPSVFSPLLSLNDRDQVLGEDASGFGVLNAHGVITPVNLSGAPGSAFPDGLNNLGQFTGTVCGNTACQGFIDTNNVFTKLDYPNSSGTGGYGINDWDQVVGEYFDSAENGYGFLYANGHFTTVQDPNASPSMGGTDPLVVNDLGQMAGWYYDAQGNMHSFIATPNLFSFATNAAAPLADTVPEPSTWAMMLLGFAGLGIAGLCRARTGHATIAS